MGINGDHSRRLGPARLAVQTPWKARSAGRGVLTASHAQPPGNQSREKGESGIHCVVVSNFLLLLRSSSEGEQCPEQLGLAFLAPAQPQGGPGTRKHTMESLGS